jgi:RNA polymerase sigma factor (TIGR02999 family)
MTHSLPSSEPEAETKAGKSHPRWSVYNAGPVSGSGDVTALLLAWGRGDREALDRLLPLVHDELRRVARKRMAGERAGRAGHSLQPTALVNEAYLRLVDLDRIPWQNRTHFFAMAARIMRRVLVDLARAKRNQKRGGGAQRVTFIESQVAAKEPTFEVTALDDALEALAKVDERKSRVVELRYFAGLTVEETAEVLGVSRLTVIRDWQFSRDWLKREIRRGGARDG